MPRSSSFVRDVGLIDVFIVSLFYSTSGQLQAHWTSPIWISSRDIFKQIPKKEDGMGLRLFTLNDSKSIRSLYHSKYLSERRNLILKED